MAYVKNTWVDQDVERPKTYEVTNNQDGSITLTDSFGLVTELGTPVNAANMNHIEDGLVDTDVTKYNATTTYNAGEWVTGVVDNVKGVYASKVNNNTGNALTNDTYWEKVELGGGATRNIGEIVESTIPLTDAGLHLLDGALLQYGSYKAFVDYIAELYNSGDYDDLFVTEADWQTAVTTYGVCGKFVYDSVNNTVRLPKYNSKIYTGEGTAPVSIKGNGTAIGVTDGMNNFGLEIGIPHVDGYFLAAYAGAYGSSLPNTGAATGIISGPHNAIGLTTDASKSGLIGTADLANITTSLDGYYYIVVATSTKTDIEVDIDEIATDLNGKADVDLVNVNDNGTSRGAGWAMPSSRRIQLATGASGATYTAPADGYLFAECDTSQYGWIIVSNDTFRSYETATIGATGGACEWVPIRKGSTGIVNYYNASNVKVWFVYAVGSESEAQ